jgi:hypothetical protein
LHRGHLPAVSKETGFVKRFTYRHSLHIHRIERVSCDCSIWANAFNAISRIASRAAFSGLTVESIDSIPSVEICQPICAICAPRDEVRVLSCSYERIYARPLCLEQKQLKSPSQEPNCRNSLRFGVRGLRKFATLRPPVIHEYVGACSIS